MNEIGVKQGQVKEQNFNKKIDSNRISNLPCITSFLLPKGYKLLPNTSELFELELAFYESQLLEKDEIIRRGAFLEV